MCAILKLVQSHTNVQFYSPSPLANMEHFVWSEAREDNPTTVDQTHSTTDSEKMIGGEISQDTGNRPGRKRQFQSDVRTDRRIRRTGKYGGGSDVANLLDLLDFLNDMCEIIVAHLVEHVLPRM